MVQLQLTQTQAFELDALLREACERYEQAAEEARFGSPQRGAAQWNAHEVRSPLAVLRDASRAAELQLCNCRTQAQCNAGVPHAVDCPARGNPDAA
jgi:hypothetical protein